MAFKDIEKEMYDGSVILKYKDSTHRYTAVVDGVKKQPASATGILDSTLEKKGLQTWPMGLALRHLTGFYDFDGDDGVRLTGFSQGVGVLWGADMSDMDSVLSHCLDASKEWTRQKKAGADIGTLVHSVAEQYLNGENGVDITIDSYRQAVIEKEGIEAINEEWEAKAEDEVAKANLAFSAFKTWWVGSGARVEFAEEILYSKQYNLAGTCDYLLEIPGKGLVLADLKTTKASVRAGAPHGVYKENFIQLGLYAMMHMEMGGSSPDDLMIISARKDGGFNTVYASEVNLTIDDCIKWAKAVIVCYQFRKETIKNLGNLAGVSVEE